MQKLLADYLFLHKNLALPQIGSLQMVTTAANVVLGEQKIVPPKTEIVFSNVMVATAEVEKYIAAINYTSQDMAAIKLKEFAINNIVNLNVNENFTLENIGTFNKTSDGTLQFTPIALPQYFIREVPAEKVTHPDDTHAILVGDKQTDNGTMAEYYAENETVKKDKWWLWAAILLAVAAGAVFYYFTNNNSNANFGITIKTKAEPASATYKMIP